MELSPTQLEMKRVLRIITAYLFVHFSTLSLFVLRQTNPQSRAGAQHFLTSQIIDSFVRGG